MNYFICISSNIESIKIYTFSHCPKLKNVIFTEGLKTINEGAFTGSIIKEAVIPKSVSAIGSRAFPDSTKLTLLNEKPHTPVVEDLLINEYQTN